MPRVAASEYDLLTVARALVGEGAPEAVEPLLRRERSLPRTFGPTAMTLLKRTLSRGVVLAFARRGAWRRSRFLQGDKVVAGRTWERHDPPALVFSARSMHLLRWLVSQPLGANNARVLTDRVPPTLGDRVLHLLACELMQRTGLESTPGRHEAFAHSPLCWLAWPELLSREAEAPPLDFAPLVTGDGAVVLEGLQPYLAERVEAVERLKQHVGSCERMVRLGRSQERTIEAFLAAADAAGRRDLSAFLPMATAKLLEHPRPPSAWIGSLESRASLRERMDAFQAAGAVLRVLEQVQQWSWAARHVHFIDDEYDAAQLVLQQWAVLGDDAYNRGQVTLRELGSLDAALDGSA